MFINGFDKSSELKSAPLVCYRAEVYWRKDDQCYPRFIATTFNDALHVESYSATDDEVLSVRDGNNIFGHFS